MAQHSGSRCLEEPTSGRALAGAQAMDGFDEGLRRLGARGWKYPVAQIENVAQRAGGLEDVVDARFELRLRKKERGGIQVALHANFRTEQPARLVDLDPPVQSEHIGSGPLHQGQKRSEERRVGKEGRS